MSNRSKFPIPAPVIAIIVLVVGYFVANSVMAPKDESAPPEPQEEATETETPPSSTTKLKTYPDLDVGPIVTPVSDDWSTYHGGPTLSGFSNAALPDEPVVRWRKQVDEDIIRPPVADAHAIYFCTYKGEVHAVSQDGASLWSRQITRAEGAAAPARIDAPLAVFDERVIAATLSGKVYALDNKTGENRWVHDIDGTILGTPNLHRPDEGPAVIVVLRQDDGLLIGINAESGDRLWESAGPDRCDGSIAISEGQVAFGSCAAAVHLRSAGDGNKLKDIEFDSDSQVPGGVVFAGNSLFSGSHSGRVFHVHAGEGKIIWINEDARDEVSTVPALAEDTLVFSSYDEHVYAVERKTGKLRWKYDAVGLPTSPVIAGDKVLFGADGVLHMLSLETGDKIWSYEVSDEIASPSLAFGLILVASEDGTVTAFGAPEPQP